MIEKTRKKQCCPWIQKNYIQRLLPVLLFNFLLIFSTNLYAQPACNAPTGHTATFNIAADCGASQVVTDGNAYNLTVDPNVTYSFTVCDPNYTAGGSQPYLELWDAPNGNFLALSTVTNGCATVTHSNCTPIQDYSLFVHTQHGTSMCDVDNVNYEFTSTCTPNTYICPTTTSHFKAEISSIDTCCYRGLIPLPDLSTAGCQNNATYEFEYTNCDGTMVVEPVVLPDPDNMVYVELPYQSNSSNIEYTVTVGGVAVNCVYPVTVVKGLSCMPNMNVPLDAACSANMLSTAFTNQSCEGVPYDVIYTVNGAEVQELTSAYLEFTNIQAVTTAPNGNTCSTTIKLMDELAPKFTSCPADITLTCGQSTDVADTGMAIATDCSGIDGAVTFVDSPADLPNCGGKVITRTFYATDTNGQTGSCQQTITLEPINIGAIDPPPHYIDADATGSNEMVLSCEDYSIATPPGVDVTGGLEINGMVLSVGMSCDYMITMSDELIPICGGSYDIIRTWEITNWCDPTVTPFEYDQYIKVMDAEGPEGTEGMTSFVNDNNSCMSTVTVGAASWVDGCSPLSASGYTVTLSGSGTSYSTAAAGPSAVFSNVPYGLYNVTWCARDVCDNEDCVSSTITLSDNTRPVAFCEDREIVLNGDNNYEFSFCANLLDDGSQDNCGSVDLLIKKTAETTTAFTECVDLGCSNISAPVNLTLQVTDESGNVASVDCDVTVILGEPVCPMFTDIEINCNEDLVGATGWGEFTYANTSDCNLNDFVMGDLVDITDVCGPTTVLQVWRSEMTGLECEQTVRISPLLWDNTSFVPPVDVTLDCSNVADINDVQEAEIAAANPNAILNIDKSNICYPTQVLDGVLEKTLFSSNGCEAIVLKTYKIIDQCLFTGNLAAPVTGEPGFYTYTQTITVADNTAPTFDVTPADVTVDCTFQLPTAPTATDDCGTAIVTVDASSLGTPDEFGNYSTAPGMYTITYNATDACNNSNTATATVTVNSTEPVITCLLTSNSNIDLGDGVDCQRTLTVSDIFTTTDPCNIGLNLSVEQIADPANPSTTAPNTTSVSFGSDDLGVVFVQVWVMDQSGTTSTEVCTFNITDENCACTVVDFDLTGSIEAGCNLTATVSNITVNGVAANASDFMIIWPASTGCGNVTACGSLNPGTYDVIVMSLETGCSAQRSVTVMEDLITNHDFNFQTSCCSIDENDFSLASFEYEGAVITDFTNFEVNLINSTGTVVCADLASGEICEDQPEGTYFIQIFTPNGCEANLTIAVFCQQNCRIGGLIANEEGDEVDNVTVKISDAIDPFVTDETGAYVFDEVNEGANYTVTPNKNVEPLNGVTTLDLVLISKHILGIELLDSPFKMIAADVNNSGTITTLDLVKIQRVILGLDADFAPMDAWCFVDGSFTFPNPANPFQTTIPEIYPINNFSGDMMDVDFVGVKVGDVNGSAIANQLLQSETRSKEALNFTIENQAYDRGETFEVNFTSDAFESMLGFQFTFQFDADALEFVAFKSGTLDQMSNENIGLSKVEDGLITTSWFNHKAISTEANDDLFTLVFKAKQSGDLSDAFKITSGITSNEIYSKANGDIETFAVNLQVNGAIDNSKEVTLFQNSPNPFTTSTTIQFYLPEAEQASILIFDYSGKVITEINRRFEKGMNEILIDKATLKTTGVLFYQLETQQFTATKKMLLIK